MSWVMKQGRRATGTGWLVPVLLLLAPGRAAAQAAADPGAPPVEEQPDRSEQATGDEEVEGQGEQVGTATHLLSPREREEMALLLSMTREQRSQWVQDLFAREPTCTEVQQAGLRHFRITPEDLADQRRLLMNKGAVPVALLSQEFENTAATRSLHVSSSLEIPTNTTAEGHRAQRHRNVGVLSMHLPHLVFNTSVLQSYAWTQLQHHVLKFTLLWYFLRRQYQTRLYIDPPSEGRAYAALALPIATHTGLLDSYTGGWFSRHLPTKSE